MASQADFDESKLPSFGTIVGIIMIPLVLIILDSLAGVIPAMAPLSGVLGFLGEPFVALLIATVVAMYLLGTRHGYSNEELEKVMTKSLEPTGLILLVTAQRRRASLYAAVFRSGRGYRKCSGICCASHGCGSLYCSCSGSYFCRFCNRCHDNGRRES